MATDPSSVNLNSISSCKDSAPGLPAGCGSNGVVPTNAAHVPFPAPEIPPNAIAVSALSSDIVSALENVIGGSKVPSSYNKSISNGISYTI